MTSLFDPMTSSSSPALDMLEGALETEKSGDVREPKVSGSTNGSPEPESVTVTVSTVRDDPSVGPSNCLESQQNPAQNYAISPNAIQFQYRTDNGHVHNTPSFDGGPHIRVVQVHGDESDPAVERVDAVSGNNFVQASHVSQQTVIQSPFAESPPNPGTVDNDSSRFAYYPQGNNEQGNSSNVQTENIDSNTAYIVRTVPVSGLSQPSSPIPATNVIPVTQGAQGQFYVMMPQDVLQGGNQRTIAPRGHASTQKAEGPRTPRDEKRRATHNEVERRRRDKINNWIEKLAKLVPNCQQDHTKQGQSKGGVLEKTVDYIHDLRANNARMNDVMKDNERLLIDAELLRHQFEEATKENTLLRTQLQQHGIEPATISPAGPPH